MSDRSIHHPFALPDVAGVAARGWTALVCMLRAHQTRRLLGEMDDRMLADIGISRGDAQTEAARPMWELGPR
ncbi:MAG: hypothetical protein NVSMB18_16890 [Acetobacteraceae bacterium]